MKSRIFVLAFFFVSCSATKPEVLRRPIFPFPFIFHYEPTLPGAFHGGGLQAGAKVDLYGEIWTVYLGGGWFLEVPDN